MPASTDVALVIIIAILSALDLSWGSAGQICVSSSQCRMSMTHMGCRL